MAGPRLGPTELWFFYEPDPSGYGSISASLSSLGWSGGAHFAAAVGEITPLLTALSQYPLRGPARLSIGILDDGTLIAVTISPGDGRGGLQVDVELRDDRDRRRCVTARLRTVYSDLQVFRTEFLEALQNGGEAVL